MWSLKAAFPKWDLVSLSGFVPLLIAHSIVALFFGLFFLIPLFLDFLDNGSSKSFIHVAKTDEEGYKKEHLHTQILFWPMKLEISKTYFETPFRWWMVEGIASSIAKTMVGWLMSAINFASTTLLLLELWQNKRIGFQLIFQTFEFCLDFFQFWVEIGQNICMFSSLTSHLSHFMVNWNNDPL